MTAYEYQEIMRIEALTFFRFLAAFIVVVYHYGKKTKLAEYLGPFITSGAHMVTFFFVLSGFVLMISHYNRVNESLRSYYVSRVSRIAPVYFMALFIMVYYRYGMGHNNPASLLLSITFLQAWFTPYPLSLNGPGWSLSVEAFFYLTFPLIIFIIRNSHIKPITLCVIAVVFYGFTQAILSNLLSVDFYDGFSSASHDLIYYFPLSHYCSFILGVSGGYIYVHNKNLFLKEGAFPLFIMLAAIYISYYFLQNPSAIYKLGIFQVYGTGVYALLFLITILGVSYSKSFITKIMSMPFFVLLGESSYALYILQTPVYVIYTKHISDFSNNDINKDFIQYFLILAASSIITFQLIEKPGKSLILRLNSFFTSLLPDNKEKETIS